MRKAWFFFIALVLTGSSTAMCQQDPSTGAGFKPYGSFEGSDVDSVNLENGNVMLHIPLASYPQRGGQLKFNITTRLNNISWTIRKITNPLNPNIVTESWYLPSQSAGVHVVFDGIPQGTELMDQSNLTLSGIDGIQISTPDGTSHYLEPASLATATSGTGDWRAIDATGYLLHISTGTGDSTYGLAANGIRVNYPSSGVVIQDTNGNQMSCNGSSGVWTDTLGRTFPPATCGSVSASGNYVNGTPIGSQVVPGMFSGTSTTDYTGCTGSPSSASILTLPGYGSSSSTTTVKLCYRTYSLTSNMGGTYVTNKSTGSTAPIAETTTSQSLLHDLVLPDGTSWLFDYDGRGDLSKLTYPTGGTIGYTWNEYAPPYADQNGGGQIWIATRAINAGSGTSTWQYSGCGGSLTGVGTTCTVTDPNLNDAVHVFSGACSSAQNSLDGVETSTQNYAGTGSSRALLRRVDRTYSSTSFPWWSLSPSLPGCINTVLTGTTTTLSDVGKVSKTTTTYDTAGGALLYLHVNSVPQQYSYPLTFGLPVSSTATDFGSGSPGATIRQSATTYMWQSNSNFISANLLSRVATSQILNGNGNLCAETDMAYDETTPQSSGVTKQHIAVSGTLGNLTTATRQLSSTPCQSGATWNPASTTTIYYDTGMPHKVTDPGGHTTSYLYALADYGAYLTQTDLPSTTNAGGTFYHITNATYDFNTGSVTSYSDQNGNTSSYTYDNMNRMVSAVFPDTDLGGNHGETDFYYSDAVTIERKQRLHDSVWSDEYMQLDGLARTCRTINFNDQSGNSWNQDDTCYDSLGRVAFESYTYQSTGFNVSKRCSGAGDSFTYDALGRIQTVKHSDGTVATNNYAGAAVDSVTEGNGTTAMERVSQNDALGHLISVCEVSSNTLSGISGTPLSNCGQDIAKPGFLTTYAYDALGNMKSASQAGLAARTFVYDSFNRLTSAYNPESGTTSYSWNTDGELISRTRPTANVPLTSATTTTTYTYDALHRVRSKSYSDGATPAANYVYDGGTWLGESVASGIGHLIYSYTGSSAGSPRTADLEWAFDRMGRTLKTGQCLPGTCPGSLYEQDYSYDLLGNAETGTDGLGHTMTWTYSADSSVTEVQASFASQPLMSGVVYGPFGVTNVTLGNTQTETNTYDGRGRLKTVKYMNPASQITYWISLTPAPDGSITTAADTVNGTWTYGYDEFNRLTSAQATTGMYNGMTLNWSYDRYGNRLTQSASGTNPNPVTQNSYNFTSHQIGGFCYDAAGNLLDQINCAAAGNNHTYTYDAEGRLSATAGVQYEYSAADERKAKDDSSGTPTAFYLTDGSGNQIAELNASLAVQHINVYSGNHLVGTYTPSSGLLYYAYSDWLGTKRYETDASGNLVNSWTSLPFGDSLAPTHTSAVDATEQHFTGREHDSESGLDYFKARYYQSQTGRWLLPDWSDTPVPVPYATFTNPQSLNLYTYVGNNPVNAVDADGHVENSNATSFVQGGALAQHVINCGQGGGDMSAGQTEPDCMQNANPAIMDDAILPRYGPGPPTGCGDILVARYCAGPAQQQNGQPAPTNSDGTAKSPNGDVPAPPDGKGPDGKLVPNEWVPGGASDTGDRPGKWKPKYPIPGQSQPGVSWDPDGHWDHDNGKRGRTRWLPNGGGQVGHGNRSMMDRMRSITPGPILKMGAAGVVIYIIIDEGSRLYPPRNLVPVP
jgi:RHS repeat-associated protein